MVTWCGEGHSSLVGVVLMQHHPMQLMSLSLYTVVTMPTQQVVASILINFFWLFQRFCIISFLIGNIEKNKI